VVSEREPIGAREKLPLLEENRTGYMFSIETKPGGMEEGGKTNRFSWVLVLFWLSDVGGVERDF